jgi:hypothetical protein
MVGGLTTRKSGANARAICAPKPADEAVIRATFCTDMVKTFWIR